MNDGFVRGVSFFINNMRAALVSYLMIPIILFYRNWFIDVETSLNSVFILTFTIFSFGMAMQHYLYHYKTAKAFSITGKNYLAACHVNLLLLCVISTAEAWIIRCVINFNEFTIDMLGIVFLSSAFWGLLGEFCGILFFKRIAKFGGVLYIILITVCTFYVFAFSFVVFGHGTIKIAIPKDTFLLVSALVFPILSVIFYVINGLMAKNLELQS